MRIQTKKSAKTLIAGVLCILNIILSTSPFVGTPYAQATESPQKSGERLIVKYKSQTNDSDKERILGNLGAQKLNSLSSEMDVVVASGKTSDKSLIGNLKSDENVEFVEVDRLVKISVNETVPNDPLFINQWHLRKTKVSSAWSLGQATNVKLAVCDTGVEANHPDLASSLDSTLGYNTVDNSTNWQPVHPHGTMTSGVIAAQTNNSTGVSGIAWGAKIIPVRISNFTDGAAFISDAAECVIYAAKMGAKAINLSYAMADSPTIDEAAKFALTRKAVTVVAAGNDASEKIGFDYSSFLTVSATDEYDQLAWFSTYGKFIDIAAPGINISTTYTGQGYTFDSGTSFSAPVVTGIIGLIYAKNSTLSATGLKRTLVENTDDIGPMGQDKFFGHGRVNACKAVHKAAGLVPNCQ